MNNRLAIGLAVGAGYVLGRTKKAKLAFGIGTMVLGKRLKLSPGALAEFAAGQLESNPQFKEIGDQLREDLRGVGKAATGALVNRQLEGIADRLHDRTLDVRDRIAGVVPDPESGAEAAKKATAPARKATGRAADRAKRSAPAKKAESAEKSEPVRRAAAAKKTAARRPPGARSRSSERAEAKGAGPVTEAKQATGLVDSAVTDRLKSELQALALAQLERALTGIGRKLGQSTVKLNDIAEGRSPGFSALALKGGRKLTEGKGPVRTALELGAGHLKENVTDTLKNLGGKRGKGGGGRKPTVIMESVDVGVPVRDAYDQWTQYQEFSHFTKGVRSASSADDTSSDWKLKVFWSSRSWKAHTTEQVPDARIAWTSEGTKGTAKGVVTFHPLGDSLTRVLLVVEYYPKGLFERTGNIWRAQGRRARLDLKNFARHIALRGEAPDGWRGEIRDGEVVLSHEDALAHEEKTRDEDVYDDEKASQGTYDPEDEEPLEGEYEEEPEGDEDVPEDSEESDAVEYGDEWEGAEEDAAEEPEPVESGRRRHVKSGSRRR